MPARYRIDKVRRTIFSTGSGILTQNDLQDHRNRLLDDPDFDPSYNHLYDFSGATELKLSMGFVRDFARQRVRSETTRIAIVAPKDVFFGGVRAYQAWHDTMSGEINVFRSMDAARRWLK
ncbi:MAG: hypothetical protein QF797_17585, partial [Alphaproteobacteria bacterium]|nr:hypothetical protein [Alphaproteobacteria bacterium]